MYTYNCGQNFEKVSLFNVQNAKFHLKNDIVRILVQVYKNLLDLYALKSAVDSELASYIRDIKNQ